jgi:hypothetical protein
MKILRVAYLVCWVLSLASVCMAQEDFKLRVAMYYSGNYVEPLDRTFKVQGNYPSSFQVIVINTSTSSQSFYENASDGGYGSISFEITDEEGNRNVVRKKTDPYASGTVSSTYMNPGEKRVFDITIDQDTWENAYKLLKQGARKFRVRAVYDNESTVIYSEYYDLEVIDPSGAKETQKSSKDNSGDTVLNSGK